MWEQQATMLVKHVIVGGWSTVRRVTVPWARAVARNESTKS